VSSYFSHVRGGTTTYVGGDGNSITECRRMLIYHGEDVDTCLKAFWSEHSREDFVIIPEVGYGVAPRKELCTQRSLVEALRTAEIEPGSRVEQQWKDVCKFYHVLWPKRLEAA
jgi:hypothetical protein